MTTFKITPADLSALRQGKTIERTGGPTIKIVLTTSPSPRMQSSLTPERIAELKTMMSHIRIGPDAWAESVDDKPAINVLFDALYEVILSLSHD